MRQGVVLALVMAAALGGCYADPAAPLIPLPQQPATVLPSEAPTQTADGFPNILADPGAVPGMPRDPRGVDEEKAAVASRGAHSRARTAQINRTSFAGSLQSKAAREADAVRARIAATGQGGDSPVQPSDPNEVRQRIASGSSRPSASGTATGQPGAGAAPQPGTPQADPGRPIDPNAAAPRAVGPDPYPGAPVAPAQ